MVASRVVWAMVVTVALVAWVLMVAPVVPVVSGSVMAVPVAMVAPQV
ncbi:MAG: hypothetical protein ABI307_15715 [Mycobacterium sp.]